VLFYINDNNTQKYFFRGKKIRLAKIIYINIFLYCAIHFLLMYFLQGLASVSLHIDSLYA